MNSSAIIAICITVIAMFLMANHYGREHDKLRAQLMIECLKQQAFDCKMR